MRAGPDAQLRLLDLQAVDTRLDRLAHRRRSLPELAQLAEVHRRLAATGDAIVTAETEDSDLARGQAKAEADVDQVRSRAERDRRRLDTGAVSSPRELENLQSEIASLGRRQGELEEVVLGLMERREELAARLDGLRAERAEAEAAQGKLTAARDEAYADIDAETARLRSEREGLAAGLPADLLALYDRVRGPAGGVGAAPLHRGRCEGCHLTLNAADLGRIRAAADDAVLRCEECGRILVRTPESGI